MPEYLAPGVYIEEISLGAKPLEGVSTSTAGFLGQTERGPVDLRLITDFGQFQRLYGGYLDRNYLAYAVDGFFRNGGQRCYIGRIVGNKAVPAEVSLSKESKPVIKVSAIGPGDWGKHIAVRATNEASLASININKELFKLEVFYWKDPIPTTLDDNSVKTATVTEMYDNLSADPKSSDYYCKMVNGISNLVSLDKIADGLPDLKPEYLPLTISGSSQEAAVALENYRGSKEPGKRTGLAAFEEQEDISIVCIPDENEITGVTAELVDHCEKMKDRFAIIQSAQSAGSISDLKPPKDTKYSAFYYPWISIIDPATNAKKLIPPGGYVAGVYARTDTERGVHKAPANEVLRGAVDLEINLTKNDIATLNPKGVNCIRAFPGRGIRIWGARTSSSDPSWKYLNVRRLFIFIEKSINRGTQWVVFEPNDEKLWARVKQTISQFLIGVWKDGALMGTTQEEAFFVKCDRTTMTQDDIDNGRIIILIGVAPVKPAEFVIFRIAQVAKGSEISE